MIRKIITYSLLSIFLLSTIGVPVTIHYCQMMKSVSFQVCEMCESAQKDCCSDNKTEENLVSYKNDSCCSTKIIADPLTEKFISAFSEIPKVDVKSFVYLLPSEVLLSANVTNSNFASDSSPPVTFSNSLYLSNSIFLI